MENSGNIGGIGAVTTEGTSPGCANDVILVGIPVVGCFGCTLCNEEFDRAARLSRHARERHLTPMTFVCSTCGRSDGYYLAATIHHGKCTGPRPELPNPRRPAYPQGCKTSQGSPGRESRPRLQRTTGKHQPPENSIYFDFRNVTKARRTKYTITKKSL
ncbi:hypothetical protein AVEN_62168-1 [Araneus ventricosus]|uniref:C2H2-type domain-containing protein n=1 Tax=Araneus ventricosus TaxID=182803 RepID=A0A4Y2AFB5_ARAVE|nr:hypothetical protein AVEN_62168-1 [Araneus ventricosus]